MDILFVWCRAKQKAGEREAAKGARRAAAASASVATSAPHAALEPPFANGRASSTAPPPPLMAGGPPGFENMGGNGGTLTAGSPPPGFEHMGGNGTGGPPGFEHVGGNGGISGHDNGRRFGYGGYAATKQLPQLRITAEESPGLPVPSPAQSSAPGAHIPILTGSGMQCLSYFSCSGLLLSSHNITMIKT